MRPYTINGKTYYPTVVNIGDRASGIASWYGPDFHGKKTSNGEIYNMNDLTAAHKTLPMNTMVKVTHINNGKSVIVRVNDRGPFVAGRVIDLSKAAATAINMIGTGTAPVKLEVVGFNGNINDASINNHSLSYKPDKMSKKIAQNSVVGGNFMVQIGAFKNIAGANTYKKQYANTNENYQTLVRSFELDDGKIYRVFLTGFRSEDEARDFIMAGHIDGAFFVRE
ncbi:MAG: septal ring lytic transglycosylase RlpA family protein [Campylobacter sp.]